MPPIQVLRKRAKNAVNSVRDEMQGLAQKLIDSEIGVDSWHDIMQDQIKRIHLTSAIAANNGNDLTDDQLIELETKIASEFDYLSGMRAQIQSGEQALDGSLINRAGMYGNSGKGTFENHHRDNKSGDEEPKFERRRLAANAQHCQDCIDIAELGWQPFGTLPEIGEQCQCISNCKCYFEYKYELEAEEEPQAPVRLEKTNEEEEKRASQWRAALGGTIPISFCEDGKSAILVDFSGTSEGVKKAWESRERAKGDNQSRKEQADADGNWLTLPRSMKIGGVEQPAGVRISHDEFDSLSDEGKNAILGKDGRKLSPREQGTVDSNKVLIRKPVGETHREGAIRAQGHVERRPDDLPAFSSPHRKYVEYMIEDILQEEAGKFADEADNEPSEVSRTYSPGESAGDYTAFWVGENTSPVTVAMGKGGVEVITNSGTARMDSLTLPEHLEEDEMRYRLAIAMGHSYSKEDFAKYGKPKDWKARDSKASFSGTSEGVKKAWESRERAKEKDSLGFYSRMVKALDALGSKPVPVEALKNRLKKTKESISDEEWNASRMDEFLAGKKSVTKEEIENHLEENRVKVKEVIKHDGGPKEDKGNLHQLNMQMTALQKEINAMKDERDLTEVPPEREAELNKAIYKKDNEYYELQDEARKLHDKMQDNSTEYNDYHSGGSNYREMLLTLDKTNDFNYRFYSKGSNEPQGIITREEYNKMDEHSRSILERHGRLEKEEVTGGNYKSVHWKEPNILAHIRMNDQEVDGKKALHVEEIQSDWHQAGRERGYRPDSSVIDNAKMQLQELRAKIAKVSQPYQDLHDEIQDKYFKGKSHLIHYMRTASYDDPHLKHVPREVIDQWKVADRNHWSPDGELTKLKEDRDKVSDIVERAKEQPPDAPFKETWHDLALKRILDYAVKNGYEGVTFNHGEHINRVLNGGQKEEESLNGQEQFYDKVIPNWLNKYGKKHGASASEKRIPFNKINRDEDQSEDDTYRSARVSPWHSILEEGHENEGGMVNGHSTYRIKPSTGKGEVLVTYLPITESMRKAVTEDGHAMFSASLPDVRQLYDYDCGDAVVLTLARYFGRALDTEDGFIDFMGTNPKDGTQVDRMIRVLTNMKLNVSAIHNMSIEDLVGYVSKAPVIVAYQDNGIPGVQGDERENREGHYSIVERIENGKVYMQDPWDGKIAIPVDEFMENWHDVGMDDEIFGNYTFNRLGIVVSDNLVKFSVDFNTNKTTLLVDFANFSGTSEGVKKAWEERERAKDKPEPEKKEKRADDSTSPKGEAEKEHANFALGLAKKVVGGVLDAEHAAKEWGTKQFEKLPGPIRIPAALFLKTFYGTYVIAAKAVDKVAEARGMEEKDRHRLSSVVGFIDAAGMKGNVAVGSFLGGPAVGAIASFAPIGSIGYLTYALATSPVTVFDKTKEAVVDYLKSYKETVSPKKKEEEKKASFAVEQSVVEKLADHMMKASDKEYWTAVIFQCYDQGVRDIDKMIETADALTNNK